MHISDFKPVSFRSIEYWYGTYKTFGFRSVLTLASPLANIVLNWKYRNCHLVIDESAFPFKNGDEYSQPKVIKGGQENK